MSSNHTSQLDFDVLHNLDNFGLVIIVVSGSKLLLNDYIVFSGEIHSSEM